MRILNSDVLQEEESVVEFALAEMERRGIQVPAPPPQSGAPRAGLLALVATLLIGVGYGAFSLFPFRPAPGEIVRRIMSTERPFQARLSDQRYIPMFDTRGPDDDPAGRLVVNETGPGVDTYLLGTYYLYVNEFEKAIAILNEVAVETDEVRVHNNLGVAYLEMPSQTREEQAVNRSRARLHFERARAIDPGFEPSAYNLALLYYREDLPGQLAAESEAYLQLDPDSPWADEIRELIPN
jgi:tetratricopeptide (TPR) repeat protein